MKKAFTLIELLVVIAIIAILAAILFPVFAQAKLAAKKTQVLSNAKQIGLALYMYTNDWDDTTAKLGSGVDWTNQLYPYVKNEDLFMNPLRNDYDSGGCATAPTAGSDEPNCRYVGFGYNWGPLKRRGGGLLQAQQDDPNYPATSSDAHYIPGVSLTSVVAPADMFAFSVSYDTPRITMGIQFLQCTFHGTHQGDEFFAGQWPVVYADGHAKAIQWQGGFGQPGAEGHRFAVPANHALVVDFCRDPSINVDQSGDTAGSGISPTDGLEGQFCSGGCGLKCSDLPAIFDSFPTAPYDPSAGSPAYLPN